MTVAVRRMVSIAGGGRAGATPDWLLDDELPCVGRADLFFPPVRENIDAGYMPWPARYVTDPWALARKVCARCPVSGACLDRDLGFPRTTIYGFVGGLDPWERRQESRRRRVGE